MATAQLDMYDALGPAAAPYAGYAVDEVEWVRDWRPLGYVLATTPPDADDRKLAQAVDCCGWVAMVNLYTRRVWLTTVRPDSKLAARYALWEYVVPPETVARCAPCVYAE